MRHEPHPPIMFRRRIAVFLTAVAVLPAIPLLFLSPRIFLARRVQQLEAQNERLRRSVRELAAGGEAEGHFGEEKRRRDSPSQVHGELSCEDVHVAIVAAGHNTSRDVVTLVKSLLFHRRAPLHFHFVSDGPARHTLQTVFSTWQLPAVNVTFHSAEAAKDHVSWIPNVHYSGVYGLMKLTLPDILPRDVERVVVLDTDLTFTADIVELWKYLAVIRRTRKLIGLVENQSDWYLGKLWRQHPWPALGRGFNSGVMLMDLDAMRLKQWGTMWRTAARNGLQEFSSTILADQDIFNVVIKEHPDIHYILPCSWNVQLSDNTLSDYCLKGAEEFKIVHWNSPKKLQVLNTHAEYFRNLHHAFEQYNGYLLRSELLSCSRAYQHRKQEAVMGSGDPCTDFHQQMTKTHRTHPFYLKFSYTSNDPSDITLVTQLSMDRLHMVDPLCAQWDGPISITVYATDAEVSQLLSFLQSSPAVVARKNLALHVVYREDREFYPVNYLRNVALSHVRTPYVFLNDIDFLPMENLYAYLKEAIRVLGMANGKRALVVPAFESLLYKTKLPQNKAQLLEMLADHSLIQFRQNEWPAGHAPTNYQHWETASVPYRVHWAPHYEPYIAVTANVSRYDERFVGFGWNKVSHIMELAAQGYDFVVLPDAFIVHFPHAPSIDISHYRSSKHYRDCTLVIKREFQQSLVDRYGADALKLPT